MTSFRLLLNLFQARFVESDSETNIYQILGAIATPGLFVSLYLMPDLMSLALQQPGPAVDRAIRVERLFFPAYSFAVTGFATIFEWDTLFPDRRDFLILAPFPIRLRELFAAKFAALCIFLSALIAVVNLFPALLLPIFSTVVPKLGAAGLIRLTAAQIAATAGASAFAFFAVAAFQGILINITTPRVFRKLSPAIQMCGMSVMVLALCTYPIYAMLLRPAAQWLWFFPPVWFTGIYDLLLPGGDQMFANLGLLAIKALAVAVGVFTLAWLLGFRRHYRRMLESEDTGTHTPAIISASCFIRSPEERVIFDFSGKTLARSTKHRLFLATYLSVGISVGLLTTVVVRAGKLGVSQDGLRSFPFLIAFFVISGFRAGLQFPAELASNWIFRLTEAAWAETARSAARKRVLLGGLVPTLTLLLPCEIAIWGGGRAVLHILFQLTAGALLIEALFWTFNKVPFTCSYFPGNVNLALLAVLYLYGFTTYSFQMADLEKALDADPKRALVFYAAAAAALIACWHRHPAASAVRFDAAEPEIQILDLT